MEEKKEAIRFSLSSFLLMIAVIVICIMGCLLFTLYRDKKKTDEKIMQLEARIVNIESQTNITYEDEDEDLAEDEEFLEDEDAEEYDIEDSEDIEEGEDDLIYEYIEEDSSEEDDLED